MKTKSALCIINMRFTVYRSQQTKMINAEKYFFLTLGHFCFRKMQHPSKIWPYSNTTGLRIGLDGLDCVKIWI